MFFVLFDLQILVIHMWLFRSAGIPAKIDSPSAGDGNSRSPLKKPYVLVVFWIECIIYDLTGGFFGVIHVAPRFPILHILVISFQLYQLSAPIATEKRTFYVKFYIKYPPIYFI